MQHDYFCNSPIWQVHTKIDAQVKQEVQKFDKSRFDLFDLGFFMSKFLMILSILLMLMNPSWL